MLDSAVETLLEVFDRHPDGGTIGQLSPGERTAYKSARRLAKSVVEPAVELGLGKQPCKKHVSAVFPTPNVPRRYWACLYPSGVADKHYAMWMFVDLSRRGVEVSCFLGWGDVKTDKVPEYALLVEQLKRTRQRLRDTPESVRVQLRAELVGQWTFQTWRIESDGRGDGEHLRSLDEWLAHAGGNEAMGCSISRHYARGGQLTTDELAADFCKAVKLFGPLFDVAYPEPMTEATPVAKQPKPPHDVQRLWVIAAGKQGEWWPGWQADGIATIGWSRLGDLRQYPTKQAVLAKLEDGQVASVRPTSIAHGCWQFVHDMQAGDLVVVKSGRRTILGAGKVESDYRFDDTRPRQKQIRDVRWLRTDPVPLPDGVKSLALKTLTNVSGRPELVSMLTSYATSTKSSVDVALPAPPYTIDDAMAGLFMSRLQFESVLERLRRKKNLILQGSPGVGKTFVAERIAYALLGEKDRSRVETVQFHQSYAYEDFVQGWRPDGRGGFELRDGLFHDLCTAARNDPGRPHVLVIDEINRGNVSRIFGELLMLIEAGYRGPGHAIPLMYARGRGDRFHVPDNLYLVGLMNTADRSLAIVDYALRRRFAFATVEPGFGTEAFAEHLADAGADQTLRRRICDGLAALNEAIAADKDLGPGFRVGHSYFCPPAGGRADAAWYRDVIECEVGPLLREYWFDNADVADRHVGKLLA